jgi:hypothetical protein
LFKMAIREFPCGTSRHIAWIGSSPLFFFIPPWPLSYGGFNQLKTSIFILVKRVHQLYSLP